METISVIIPVYNVENYIAKCLDSIIAQSYSDLEIILVDDGSADSTVEICRAYTLKDNRIKLFEKKHGGIGDTRNYGLEKANGEYIAFIDSDDYVTPDYFSVLHKNLKETNADISICDCRVVYGSAEDENVGNANNLRICSNVEALGNYMTDLRTITIVPWSKIYKKHLFDGILYPTNRPIDDEYTTHKLIYKARTVVYSDSKMYFYIKREDSVSGISLNVNRIRILDAYDERIRFFNEHNLTDLAEKTAFHYLATIFKYYEILYMGDRLPTEKKNLHILFKKIFDKRMFSKMDIKKKLFYGAFYMVPKIVMFYRRTRKHTS